MEKNLTYPETKSWRNLFSTENAHWQDMRRANRIMTPIMILVLIMVLSVVVYRKFHIGTMVVSTDPQHQTFWNTLWGQYGYILIFIILLMVISWIYYVSIRFMKAFYRPPEGTLLMRRIQQRLFGVSPYPYPLNLFWKYTSLVVKDPSDFSQEHWAHWLGGPAPLVIFDGNALYLERGNRFSRVVGPGTPPPPFLDRYETVKAVVDLRPQYRTGTFHPWTKDGIRLDLTITLVAQINSSPEAQMASRNLVYPFDPIAVKQAVEYTAVKFKPEEQNGDIGKQSGPQYLETYNPPSNIQRKKELVESDWLEGIWVQTIGYLNKHISSHSVDEIALSEPNSDIGPNTGNLYTFKLAQEHINKINELLADCGCGAHVSSIQITMRFPMEVQEHRIKYWESVRQSRSSIRMSKAEGDRIRLIEDARAHAERDMLDAITEQLKNIDPANLTEPILMSLTGILDNSLDDPLIRPIIAKNSLNLLVQLRKILKEKF
jgi:hypothetical protein